MTVDNSESKIKIFIDNLLADRRNSLQNMATIFVSSTKSDLEDERDAIIYLIQELGLSVNFMEDFGARTEPPLVTCMHELAKSDIYLGILSMNYGSTCEDTTEDGRIITKSYTEKEYDEAVFEKKPILIYMINKKEGRVIPENIDFDNQHLLEKFKKRLEQNHTVEYFSDTRDLCAKVLRDLCREVDIYVKTSDTDKASIISQPNQNPINRFKENPISEITIDVDKDRYCPSDTITVEGTITNPKSASVYLYLTKPGVIIDEINQLTDNDFITLNNSNKKFEIAKVRRDNTWKARINLQDIDWNIKGNELCYLIVTAKEINRGEDNMSMIVPINLHQPFLIASVSYPICMPNYPLTISGIAETAFSRIYLWIFSKDRLITRKKILVQRDGSFRYKFSKDILDVLSKGEEYLCLLQMPVKYREGDIGVNEDDEIVSINHKATTNSISYTPICSTTKNIDSTSSILSSIFDNERVADVYVRISFLYDDVKISMTYAELIGNRLSINFQTNLPPGTKIIYQFKGIRDTRDSNHRLSTYYNLPSNTGEKNVVTVSAAGHEHQSITIQTDVSKFKHKGDFWLSLLTYQTRERLWSRRILSSDGKDIILETS